MTILVSQTFNYLRSLLEGSAAGAIRGLPLTAENYGAAKDILKKHFGQPQIIIRDLKHQERRTSRA